MVNTAIFTCNSKHVFVESLNIYFFSLSLSRNVNVRYVLSFQLEEIKIPKEMSTHITKVTFGKARQV